MVPERETGEIPVLTKSLPVLLLAICAACTSSSLVPQDAGTDAGKRWRIPRGRLGPPL
jgi:hypothetical protein